jgi:hypothetical protein
VLEVPPPLPPLPSTALGPVWLTSRTPIPTTLAAACTVMGIALGMWAITEGGKHYIAIALNMLQAIKPHTLLAIFMPLLVLPAGFNMNWYVVWSRCLPVGRDVRPERSPRYSHPLHPQAHDQPHRGQGARARCPGDRHQHRPARHGRPLGVPLRLDLGRVTRVRRHYGRDRPRGRYGRGQGAWLMSISRMHNRSLCHIQGEVAHGALLTSIPKVEYQEPLPCSKEKSPTPA